MSCAGVKSKSGNDADLSSCVNQELTLRDPVVQEEEALHTAGRLGHY